MSTRKTEDIFKKYGTDCIFVTGDTPEERAKLLYIRKKLTAAGVVKRLQESHGDTITVKQVKNLIKNKHWLDMRHAYQKSFDVQVIEQSAARVVSDQLDDQQSVRNVYAEASKLLMNMIKQKIDFHTPKHGGAAILPAKDIKELAQATKDISDVHFRALGIAEVATVDPTTGHEKIIILTKQDMEALQGK